MRLCADELDKTKLHAMFSYVFSFASEDVEISPQYLAAQMPR